MAVILLALALVGLCIKEGEDDKKISIPLIGLILAVFAFDILSSPCVTASIIDNNKIELVRDLNYICENYTEDKKQEAITERVTEYDNKINHSTYTFIRIIYWYPFIMHTLDDIDIESINEDNYIEKIILDK